MLRDFSVYYQGLPIAIGYSAQHTRDMMSKKRGRKRGQKVAVAQLLIDRATASALQAERRYQDRVLADRAKYARLIRDRGMRPEERDKGHCAGRGKIFSRVGVIRPDCVEEPHFGKAPIPKIAGQKSVRVNCQ
jgi:hypothetical protein